MSLTFFLAVPPLGYNFSHNLIGLHFVSSFLSASTAPLLSASPPSPHAQSFCASPPLHLNSFFFLPTRLSFFIFFLSPLSVLLFTSSHIRFTPLFHLFHLPNSSWLKSCSTPFAEIPLRRSSLRSFLEFLTFSSLFHHQSLFHSCFFLLLFWLHNFPP